MLAKVYIKGVAGRGEEVIQVLEELGGINKYSHNGEDDECLYLIDNQSRIIKTSSKGIGTFFNQVILECFDEVKLPRRKSRQVSDDALEGEGCSNL